MQYGNFVVKKQKETTLEELVTICKDMVNCLEELPKESKVEKAEFIIHEETIAWKVGLLEPGEKRPTGHKIVRQDDGTIVAVPTFE